MFKKIGLWVLIVLGLGFALPVGAASLLVADETIVQDTALSDDGYFIGESVTIAKDIRGDLTVFGGNITLNGAVTGDVLVIGGSVIINGRVSDDIRIAGGNVTLAGEVGDDILLGAGNITLADTAVVRGDVLGGAGSFNIYGRVLGNINIWLGEGRINGQVGGNADVHYSEGLSFGNDAKIDGKLTYYAAVEKPEFANFAGSVEFVPAANGAGAKLGLAKLLSAAGFMALVWKWLSLVFVGALLIWGFPRLFPKMVDSAKAKDSVGKFIWTGFIFALVVPAAGLLFAITVVGLPISVILFLGYAISFLMASIVGGYGLGSFLRGHKHDTQWEQIGNLALGLLLMLVLSYVPFLGWIFQALVVLFGIGAIWFEKIRITKEYREPLR